MMIGSMKKGGKIDHAQHQEHEPVKDYYDGVEVDDNNPHHATKDPFQLPSDFSGNFIYFPFL
jgi:hypothetical protein